MVLSVQYILSCVLLIVQIQYEKLFENGDCCLFKTRPFPSFLRNCGISCFLTGFKICFRGQNLIKTSKQHLSRYCTQFSTGEWRVYNKSPLSFRSLLFSYWSVFHANILPIQIRKKVWGITHNQAILCFWHLQEFP